MTDSNSILGNDSRRSFIKKSALTTGALALGSSDTAAGQETETPPETSGDGQPDWRRALAFSDEFHGSAVFRVVSPALDDPPLADPPDAVAGWSVRVIEYFNTNQEAYLFVPPEQSLDEGELYRFNNEYVPATNGLTGVGLVEAQYRPLDAETLPFDLEEGENFWLLDDAGGEAAVRPRNFFTNALFRVTSGPQGWVPDDVARSGYFTDYDAHHAEFLGTSDEFLFFPQEDTEVGRGDRYVMWEEFEFFVPAGNLVAAEFEAVDQETITVDDEFL